MAEQVDGIRVCRFCCEWLSDGIGERFKEWNRMGNRTAASRVFIQSPTGTGKTTFILEKLYPYAMRQGRSILYLGNRVALKEQTENAIKRLFEEQGIPGVIEDVDAATIAYCPNQEAAIVLVDYQAFMGLDSNKLPNNLYYIILDEAHFFMEDALFNPWTGMLLECLAGRFANAVMVFMSATMGDSASALFRAMQKYQTAYVGAMSKNKVVTSVPVEVPEPILYLNDYRKGKYCVRFFEQPEAIVSEIDSTEKEEKWLIFTMSKRSGERRGREIAAKNGGSIEVLDAGGKGSTTWKKLIRDSRYEERVLITTKVLDNGVNINDPAVKHIVLPFCAPTDFLQMLGRKRTEPDEVINLYAEVPRIQAVKWQLYRVNTMLSTIEAVARAATYERMTELLQRYWNEGRQNIRGLFYIDNHRNLRPNLLAYEKLIQLRDYCSELEQCKDEPDYYARCVLGWMDGTGGEEVYYLGAWNFPTLPSLLESWENQHVPISQQERIYQEFMRLYKAYCYELYANNQPKRKEVLDIRKGKDQRKATINHSLKALGLPYKVKKERNCWVLRKKDT